LPIIGKFVMEKIDPMRIVLDTCRQAWQNDCGVPVGAWRSLVARLPWAQEVRGSNPRAPTNIPKGVSFSKPFRMPMVSSFLFPLHFQ
jgi:hypothetical protein